MSKSKAEDKAIIIKGARVNNLKNIDITIPQGKLVVVTGVSGSGKSSLAFDTLFAEGQRRYVESLSSYARQFLGRKSKPDVDFIDGLAPAVAIEQKVNTTNPRSTVGTSTEIYEYLKLLFARIGRTFSPISGVEVKRHSVSDVVDYIYTLNDGCKVMILAPLNLDEGRSLTRQLDMLKQEGFQRVVCNGEVRKIEDMLADMPQEVREVLLLVDRIIVRHGDDSQSARVAESVQTAFFEGRGSCMVEHLPLDGQATEATSFVRSSFSNRFEADGIVFEKPNPNFFSFNNPYGACPTCQGYGQIIGIDEDIVVPNKQLSIYESAVVCWHGEKMSEWKDMLIKLSPKISFPIHKPYCDLTAEEKSILWHGKGAFPGIDGFFKWVESQSYKIQYRVMMARYRGKTLCPDCQGSRLRKDAAYVKVGGRSIAELVDMSVEELSEFVQTLKLAPHEEQMTRRIMTELHSRIGYLIDVGLGYLTLGRLSNSLSGGESQRINLATSLGSSLVGSMYILDEPSIGLHPRDTDRLIKVLKQLRDLGNTVIVVEHDEEIMREADYIIDMGPLAGRLGGEIVFAGNYTLLTDKQYPTQSLTAAYLRGEQSIKIPSKRRHWRDRLTIKGAYCNNLKHVDVDIPLQVLTVVTGVSGSGKTSLVKHVLYDVMRKRFDGNDKYNGKCVSLSGDWSRVKSVELVDQNPIGRSTRSNPATYMKAYDEIRQLFALQPLAKTRGYKAGWFSFNVEGGRCDACEGEGLITIGMQFMADVQLKCEECGGSRFKDETLEVLYKGVSISQILDMTIDQAVDFFMVDSGDAAQNVVRKRIIDRLMPLRDVGLGYLKMGQSSSTLSGGEAQRIKLASFLIKGESEERRLFIFDEPSTGLHFHDIQKLLKSFQTLIENGHSIVVIEHHPDIIKLADWVIDMGPEDGKGGGEVVCVGTPEDIVKCKRSYTGKYLKEKL